MINMNGGATVEGFLSTIKDSAPIRDQPASEAVSLYAKSGRPDLHSAFKYNAAKSESWIKAAKTVCEAVKNSPRAMFAVIGPRGRGKTQIADAAIRQSCSMGRSAKYCKALELFFAIKASYNTAISEQSAIEPYLSPLLLVVDEIQERGETEWENRMLTYIVDRRYDKMRQTIIMGNIEFGKAGAVEPLLERVGDSIYSRLIETGGVIECRWESFRVPR